MAYADQLKSIAFQAEAQELALDRLSMVFDWWLEARDEWTEADIKRTGRNQAENLNHQDRQLEEALRALFKR